MLGNVIAAETAAGSVAVVSGTAAVVTAIGEVTTQILGVPLPVVLAALAGAALARAYLPSIGFGKATARVIVWVVLGCVLAPFAKAIAAKLLGAELPTNALAGMASIVAGAEAWPMLLHFLRAEIPWLDRFLGGKKGGGDGVA